MKRKLAKAPSWATAVQDAAAAINKRRGANGSFRLVTWNVWFGGFMQAERHSELVAQALAQAADVICLQEVVPVLLERLRGSRELMGAYDLWPQAIRSYGTAVLAHKSLGAKYREVAFPTKQGRCLGIVEFGGGDVAIGNVHLESLASEPLRKQQLAICGAEVRGRHRIVCGDFNFDDKMNWGDWRLEGQPPASRIENENLAEVLPAFKDVWAQLRPSDRGLTFVGGVNPLVSDKKEQMRYDRIVCAPGWTGWGGKRIEILGDSAFDSQTGAFPSDHYGLVADFGPE